MESNKDIAWHGKRLNADSYKAAEEAKKTEAEFWTSSLAAW